MIHSLWLILISSKILQCQKHPLLIPVMQTRTVQTRTRVIRVRARKDFRATENHVAKVKFYKKEYFYIHLFKNCPVILSFPVLLSFKKTQGENYWAWSVAYNIEIIYLLLLNIQKMTIRNIQLWSLFISTIFMLFLKALESLLMGIL